MSNSEEESSDQVGIGDDALPEDLQPGEENPLAEGLDDGETVEGLMDGGKPAETDGPAHGSDDGSDAPEGSEGSGGSEAETGSGSSDDED